MFQQIENDNQNKKNRRVELRFGTAAVERVHLAAQLSGRKPNEFIQDAALEAANKAIERHLNIEISMRDAELFANTILNPRQPNEALKAAADRYRRRTGK